MSGPAAELAQVESQLSAVEAEIESLLGRQAELQERREALRRLAAADARAPRADWAAASFPWDAQVAALLRDVFSLPSWRPLQREVINATLRGRDALALLPAGSGKSLCYQLPALVAPPGAVTLVVSPLLALIADQVAHLERLGLVAVAALTSLSTKEETSAVLKALDAGDAAPRLLYCTPERVAGSKRLMAKLERLYKAGRLARIAVDEAHCASSWGNDFRPDYRKLGVLRQQFPEAPILALTATATAAVADDVAGVLRLAGAETFRASIDRPNLFYEVKPKPATAAALADDVAAWVSANFPGGDSGIVYCLTRKDTEAFAADLAARGLAAAAYHADVAPGRRAEVHAAWAAGRLQIIVATVAFGMGVSKADVRFVVHHTMAKSQENYYQESGRAGRDGRPAHCRMYYRFGDYLRQAGVVAMEPAWEPHLRSMLRYLNAGGGGGGGGPPCRRAALCLHFAEAPAPCAAMCDLCAASREVAAPPGRVDASGAARCALAALRAVKGAERRATLAQLLDRWRASPDGGAEAKRLGRDECERVVGALVAADALRLDFGFTPYSTNVYLKIGPAATAVEEGRLAVELAAPRERGPADEVAVRPGAAAGEGSGAGGSGGGGGRGRMKREREEGGGAGGGQQQKKEPAAAAAEPEVIDLARDSDEDDFI